MTGSSGHDDDDPAAPRRGKSGSAFRTISEVALELGVAQSVLRFWETKFPRISPVRRSGGRRYYRPEDIELLGQIKQLLHVEGYTIMGVQRLIRRGEFTATHGASTEDDASASPEDPAAGAVSGQDAIERAIAELEACRRLLAAGD